jgi:hypothetical protein
MAIITNDARIRVRIVDAIKVFTDAIEVIEAKYQNSLAGKEYGFEISTADNDASRLEKALFLLAIIHPLYSEHTDDKSAFKALTYSTFDSFSNRKIKKNIKKNGFESKSEFMTARLNHYTQEINLLHEMENKHSGNITNYWYSQPLSTSAQFDKDVAHLMFFLSLIWSDIETRILSACEKIINRFSTE